MGGLAGRLFGPIAAAAVTGFLVAGGVFLGVALGQWLVLRGQVAWAGWWVVASVVAASLGAATFLGLFQALGGEGSGPPLIYATTLLAGFMVFGMAQWLILRGQVSWALWLVLASAVGLPLGGIGTGAVGALGFGAGAGVVTGGVLVWQLSQAV